MAPYPFCTIEPNVGVVPVPDDRLVRLADIVEHEEGIRPPLVPAVVEFVDIAGLVAGAAKGEGLGNKFLSHIREVDIIVHVLRAFTDPEVTHVSGGLDPDRDREIVETELILADLETLGKQQEPKGVAAVKEALIRWQVIQKLKTGLNQGKLAQDVVTHPVELGYIRDLHLLSLKPILYVINCTESQLKEGSVPHTSPVLNDVLYINARMENELSALTSAEQTEYLSELGLSGSGLDRLIRQAYKQLGLISFLTSGVKEVRAWTITRDLPAYKAAGVIHTDFEKHFIKAEVIGFQTFVDVGGWKKAREAGKVRQEGRDYLIADGDVVEFKIGK